MFKSFLFLTLKGIKYRPIRGWLTILGIVIGIMLVVIILALGGGIKNAVSKTLQMFGSDLIIILPGKDTNPLLGLLGGQKFKEKDLMNLQKIKGVKFVIPMEVASINIEYRGEKKSSMVHAAPWKSMEETYEESQGLKLDRGRWPTDDNINEVVLGYKAVNNLFRNKIRIGDEIIMKSKRMKVVGVVAEVGEQMSDNIIFLSLNIFRDMTGLRSGVGSAFVKVLPNININLVAKQIKFQLSKQESVRDFSVLTPEKSERLIDNVLSIIELVLVVIALISLLVGAVGIMNTMYTSVLERTKQIGIMKAIGASNDIVLSLFLIESGMIGLVGGVLGIIFGVLSAYLIGLTAAGFGVKGLFAFASLDFFGLFVVLFLTFVIGIVSGVLPAIQASKMEPAEALRYE